MAADLVKKIYMYSNCQCGFVKNKLEIQYLLVSRLSMRVLIRHPSILRRSLSTERCFSMTGQTLIVLLLVLILYHQGHRAFSNPFAVSTVTMPYHTQNNIRILFGRKAP